MASIFNICFLLACGACYVTAFAIRGAQSDVNPTTSWRPLRQNILDLSTQGPAWDLYLQTLRNYSQTDHHDQFSNYQISGIHGYPNVPWDGVNGTWNATGYCMHSSTLFPLWHRPYLMLYEQTLWNISNSIAAQYPQPVRDKYAKAALDFRIPYWDWSTSVELPALVTDDNVTVNTPQGSQTFKNPLKQFDFEPGDQDSFAATRPNFTNTVRTPDAAGKCRLELINQRLRDYWDSLHNEPYRTLSSVSNWTSFANQHAQKAESASIEQIHGFVHTIVGGYDNLPEERPGHMTLIPYSAFDPLFMLHHANVDRMVAIWQALHPDSWITPYASGEDNYMAPRGTTEDENTPLYPFHADDNGSFHTAKTVRHIKDLGYSYIDVPDWTPGAGPAEITKLVTERINKLYYPERNDMTYTNGINSTEHLHRLPQNATGAVRLQHKNAALAASSEWTLRVILEGTLDDPTAVTLHAPNSTAPLATLLIDPRRTSPFAPLQRTVPLSSALLAADGGADNLQPERAGAFLRAVRWEAAGLAPAPGGKGASKIARLGATLLFDVAARAVEPPRKVDEFPTYGEWEVHGRMKLGDEGHLAPA